MSNEYDNKIAIVTGGTGELGKVITDKFAQAGMKVYLPVRSVDHFREMFDNSETADTAVFKLRKIYGLQCDAENESDVVRFIEDVTKQEGKVDFLINTVGGYHPKKSIVDMDTALIERMMKLNFYSTLYFSKNILRGMIDNKYGRIVAISAMAALEISPGKFAYSVSKSAVINLMQTIAEECKEFKITTNTIVPSIIDTPANRKSIPGADFTKWVPPEEIAETVLFLVSDSARSFRGNVIKMYGRL